MAACPVELRRAILAVSRFLCSNRPFATTAGKHVYDIVYGKGVNWAMQEDLAEIVQKTPVVF